MQVDAIEKRMMAETGKAQLFVLKGRQGGITTDQQGRNLHAIWRPGQYVQTLASTTPLTDKIFQITRRAIKNFPAGLLPTMGTAKTREISFPELDSAFWTGTAGASRIGAGLTLTRFHGSESAFWPDFKNTISSLGPAMRPQGSAVVLETTASNHGDEAYEFWTECGNNGYQGVFIPWWDCDLDNYRVEVVDPDEVGKLEDDEKRLMSTRGLDLAQIQWRREKIRAMGRSLFLQEYAEDPETCWMLSGDLFFDADVLTQLMNRTTDPLTSQRVWTERWTGEVQIYQHWDGVERVVFGVDTAEGGGKDSSTYVARGAKSGKLYETFKDSKIEPKQLSTLLNQRGRHYGRAFLVVEKQAHGITVLRELRDTHKYPLSRIYHRQVTDQATKKPTLKMGWSTVSGLYSDTKRIMLDAARDIFWSALDGTYGVPCREAITDAFAVTRDDKGDVSLNGKDLLVAEMLAWIGRSHVGGSYRGFTTAI
jgi:hypothetical protein